MSRQPGRFRFSWALAFLVAGLGCVGLALAEASRSIRSNQLVADRALTGYAYFAAWSFEEHFTESMRLAVQEALGSVNMFHESPPIPETGGPGHAFRWDVECACHQPQFGPLPVAFFGFTLGSDTLGVAYNQAPRGSRGWLVDAVPAAMPMTPPRLDSMQRQHILAGLTELARAPLSRWGYQLLITGEGDSTAAFALTRMPTRWGDTIIYAVEYSAQSIDSMLAATFNEGALLPGSISVKGRNREVIALDVHDAAGQLLFAADPPPDWTLAAIEKLPPSYGGLSIRARIQPWTANRMIIGGLPRSRLPLLLALLALAAGLTAVAVVQLRREERFARARTDHVASTSHELRTPLAQIRLAVDTLRLGRETDPARRDASLALVDREVTRLQHLVDTVLRFGRGEANANIPRTPVDVAAEARAVVTEFAPLSSSRGVRIDVVATATPVVQLQAGALRQVLLNLLDNAVKYGPDRQLITVQVEALGAHGTRITVSDEGGGVVAAERERIWQPFERGSNPAARVIGGSGIGLTVVREIAERHGGKAEVRGGARADVGAGAVFVVEFPGSA